MDFKTTSTLDIILNALFNKYQENVTDVRKITDTLIMQGIIKSQSDIVNDHIAFRTLGIKHLGIRSLEKIFLNQGYTKRDRYRFESKKLDANWYAPRSPDYPRIFISELRVHELSEPAQLIIKKYTQNISQDPLNDMDLNDGHAIAQFLHQPLWDTPTKEEYDTLLKESEYAAWVIYNRYYLNHYTISVHALPDGYNRLEDFNQFLEETGIILNTAGGKIKVSQDGLLLQSSSVSALKRVQFSCGTWAEIAGSYVEFAERKILPEYKHLPLDLIETKHRREGFEEQNADKIFESTYTGQVIKGRER
jgi:hypothetical protein